MVPAIVRNAARDQLESLPAIVGIRKQILAEARKRFASSVSLEEIADGAYALVLKSISVGLGASAPSHS
jgi:hypothetical protein